MMPKQYTHMHVCMRCVHAQLRLSVLRCHRNSTYASASFKHTSIYPSAHPFFHPSIHPSIHACMHAYMHTPTCTCTYTHTHMRVVDMYTRHPALYRTTTQSDNWKRASLTRSLTKFVCIHLLILMPLHATIITAVTRITIISTCLMENPPRLPVGALSNFSYHQKT